MTTFLKKFLLLLLIILVQFIFTSPQKAYAATSPTLGTAGSYSVLGGQTVTNTGSTIIVGDVGVSPGSAIDGFPPGVIGPPGAKRSVDDAAVAQLANTAAFTSLDQGCTVTYPEATKELAGAGEEDLGSGPGPGLVPGVYCADAFELSGTLTLSGSGVWIFKSAATLITSGSANIVGGDPCNVWWREVSSATLGTGTSFIGNILASTSVSLATGATLNGRAFAQTGSVTLQGNTLNSSCLGIPSYVLTSGGPYSSYCPPTDYATPVIIDSRRVDADSVFISWGPYSGINTFNVQYGTENGKWLYSTNVTGFSTTLNNLPANTPIWVRIATTDYCSVGEYGAGRLVGGPGLPNTGFAPSEKGISWFVPAGIFVGISALFLIQRKYRFSSGH